MEGHQTHSSLFRREAERHHHASGKKNADIYVSEPLVEKARKEKDDQIEKPGKRTLNRFKKRMNRE
ncbi:hypothetical protein AKJ41_01920 [candidate division MSBL1 archaeon SCGC-AAA259O05]|uniref:Uncharacterized protein n=1 Tax=candidate division MSBL1 archaeon SCGC-AAA259O05 TaxID=1698271 RepID=A0A133V4H8_9EURY|nr:hypothetical protein AKJ41_01920 [candidate division MSBL1 archaeon SCGC-AAA259O05]